MSEISYDKLVELITQEVIKALGKSKLADVKADGSVDKRPRALVIGSCDDLPNYELSSYRTEIYNSDSCDVSVFDKIFITELTLADLADISFGRDCRCVPKTVTQALLLGKEVALLESALPHRKYESTANKKLYSMFEGYVHTLTSFGVTVVRKQWGKTKNANRNAIADNSVDKVITEESALRLIKKDEDVIYLCKGTIITPSAKDVFNHSQKTVEFVD